MQETRLHYIFGLGLSQDLRLAWRQRVDGLNPLLFFMIVITLFPLAVGSDPIILMRIGPAILWVAALLASLLGLESLFRSDEIEGVLDQMLLSPQPLAILVLAKIIAHWLVTGLPLIILTPLFALMLQIPPTLLPSLMAGLLLGTPILSIIGAIAVALTIGLPHRGLLLALLVLPLTIPILIFGTGTSNIAMQGLAYSGELLFLAGLLILALILGPWTIAAALRVGIA